MQHHWKRIENEINNWTEDEVKNYLSSGNHTPTGNLKRQKEFIKDLEYNWVIEATDEDINTHYPKKNLAKC